MVVGLGASQGLIVGYNHLKHRNTRVLYGISCLISMEYPWYSLVMYGISPILNPRYIYDYPESDGL
jgi:hypothetical protein